MRNNKVLLWAAYLGMLIFGMAMLSLGSVNNYLTYEQHLSQLTIASLAALLPFGLLVGSVLFGPVVDRFGYKILLITCTLMIALSFFLISLASSLLLLQLSFLLIGFSGGAINGGTSALVSDLSTTNKGAGLSLLGVFYGIGALGMPIVIGAMSKSFTNQIILQFFAFLALLPVVYFLFIKFPQPKQAQGFPILQGLKLFREPLILLLGFFLFFESGIEGIANNWTTTFLREVNGLAAETALFALSSIILFLTIMRLVLGYLLRKFSEIKILYISLGSIFVGSMILNFTHSLFGIVIGLSLLGAGFAAGFPVILGIVGDLYGEISGTAFSVVILIAIIGNMLINYCVGLLNNWNMMSLFPIVIMGSSLVMSVLLTIIKKKINK